MLGCCHPGLWRSDILEATHIPEPDCRRHLVSLCTRRSRILLKTRKVRAAVVCTALDHRATGARVSLLVALCPGWHVTA